MLKFKIVSNQQNKAIYPLNIIKNKATNPPISTLIDSGASFPVWVDGERSFQLQYPDCRFANAETVIGRFGGNFEVAPIYTIPSFELSDGRNKIIYHDLPIAVLQRHYSFSMIMSFTMLNKLNCSLESYTDKQGVVREISPVFKIHNHKNVYQVGYTHSEVQSKISQQNWHYFKTNTIIESIYIFAQQEGF